MDTELLTTAQAADHADRARQFLTGGVARIRPTTIREWVSRGHLTAAGIADDNKTKLYRLVDVARAERATRKHALRLLPARQP